MELKEFSEKLQRLCSNYVCEKPSECPMHKPGVNCLNCTEYVIKRPELAEAIVKEWDKAHPKRTNASVLIDMVHKKFPDCKLNFYCETNSDSGNNTIGIYGYMPFWSEEYKGEEK